MTIPASLILGLAAAAAAAVAAGPAADIADDTAHVRVRGGLPHLAAALRDGRPVRVAFLGGSITENRGGHSAMVPAWFREAYPGSRVEAVNAGLSSTCSTTGAFRLASDVFAGGPVDLLVVEFAVNDDQDAAHAERECVRGMEGIVRHVRREHPECDIVMVHFVNPGILAKLRAGDSPTSVAAHERVAEHYGVTSVDVAGEVADAVESGRYSWKDYGGTHPGEFGYRVASDLIIKAIGEGVGAAAKPSGLPGALDESSYDRGRFVEVVEAERTEGWRVGKVGRDLLPEGSIRSNYEPLSVLRGDAAGDGLRLKFEGTAVGAFVLAGPDAGILRASVDGGEPVQVDLFHRYSRGLNYPRSVIFATGLEGGEHTLRLEIAAEKNPGSSGNTASILYFAIDR